MAAWYFGENGQQIGPLEEHAIRTAIAEGRLNPQTLVWREGMAVWQPLSQVTELSVPHPPQQVYYGPTSIPGYVRTSGTAIASLVCGILGLITCIVLLGIPAVICGHMALKEIENSPIPTGGRGMAMAGLVTGYIQVAACATIVVGLVIAAFSTLF